MFVIYLNIYIYLLIYTFIYLGLFINITFISHLITSSSVKRVSAIEKLTFSYSAFICNWQLAAVEDLVTDCRLLQVRPRRGRPTPLFTPVTWGVV